MTYRCNQRNLEAWLKNEQLPASARTTALRWLIEHQSDESKSYLDLALQSKDPGLRAYARTLVFQADPAIAQSLFGELLEPGGSIPEAYAAQSNATAVDTTIERQSAISALANSNSEDAERLLMKVVQQATGHQDDCVDIQLELLQSAVAPAAENRSEAYRSMVAILSSSITNKSSLGRFQPSLWGGDAQRGKAIFLGNQRIRSVSVAIVSVTKGATPVQI